MIHEELREQCPDQVNVKVIYSVEAISRGSDCQCSCHDPPTAKECPLRSPVESAKKKEIGATPSKTLEQLNSILEDFERVRSGMDFQKIHSTVEHMILAMVQMEKSFGGKMIES